jgi:uncharacterized flavoprotein (TIGR03862 family)
MAADVLASNGIEVTLCDAKPSFGRKFLMAGKSGLNLTKDEPFELFIRHYFEASGHLGPMIAEFDAPRVMAWAKGLGQDVFTGSSGRVFPRTMKASPLLRAWLARLDGLGVRRLTRHKWVGWDRDAAVFDTVEGQVRLPSDVTVLALGGASWARLGSDGAWVDTVRQAGGKTRPFSPSNAGVAVDWSAHMRPFFGAAIKAVAWRAGAWQSRGEATLSANGLEGGGVYALTPALRAGAPLVVDLIPDVTVEKATRTLAAKPAGLRLSHWLKNTLRLSPVKTALFFEAVAGSPPQRDAWVQTIKNLTLNDIGLRPMDEAISTAGGVTFESLSPDLMLRARPGVFCAGEMLDWEAPTGGYLLTACFATGKRAGEGALRYLEATA